MGVYDYVLLKDKKGEEIDIQFKNGECALRQYRVGESIELEDGIYFGHEGVFVVSHLRIVAAFSKDDNPLRDKWGGSVDYPELKRQWT